MLSRLGCSAFIASPSVNSPISYADPSIHTILVNLELDHKVKIRYTVQHTHILTFATTTNANVRELLWGVMILSQTHGKYAVLKVNPPIATDVAFDIVVIRHDERILSQLPGRL